MRVFCRTPDGYAWKDVEVKKMSARMFALHEKNNPDPEIYITQTNILKVEDDIRKDHLFCIECGKMINDTEAAKEAHFRASEAWADCSQCQFAHLKTSSNTKINRLVQLENGKWQSTSSVIGDLFCVCKKNEEEGFISCYDNPKPIDEAKRDRSCIYHNCRAQNEFISLKAQDALVEYPELFTEGILTANAFEDDADWLRVSSECDRVNPLHYQYRTTNLVAKINCFGLLDYFYSYCRGSEKQFIYSPYYGKWFTVERWGRKAVEEEDIRETMPKKSANNMLLSIKHIYQRAADTERGLAL